MLIFHFHQHLENRRPKLWGVCNLEFFCTIDINKMVAIFQFFHNCWCWYSVSIDTWNTGHPNFGEVGNLEFFCTIDIKEMADIFRIFFIIADATIPFPLTLRKPETQTLGVCHLEFFCMIDINEMAAIFQFFHNGQCWYRLGMVNSNMINSNIHLIQSFFEILARILSFHV